MCNYVKECSSRQKTKVPKKTSPIQESKEYYWKKSQDKGNWWLTRTNLLKNISMIRTRTRRSTKSKRRVNKRQRKKKRFLKAKSRERQLAIDSNKSLNKNIDVAIQGRADQGHNQKMKWYYKLTVFADYFGLLLANVSFLLEIWLTMHKEKSCFFLKLTKDKLVIRKEETNSRKYFFCMI